MYKKYKGFCEICLKPRSLSSNKTCRACNKLRGLKQCKICNNILSLFLEFYQNHGAVCKKCYVAKQIQYNKSANKNKKVADFLGGMLESTPEIQAAIIDEVAAIAKRKEAKPKYPVYGKVNYADIVNGRSGAEEIESIDLPSFGDKEAEEE